MENLKIAMVVFGFGFLLSLLAMRHRKPGGKLFSPIWKMKEHYTARGVALNSVALGLLVLGFVFYVLGTR